MTTKEKEDFVRINISLKKEVLERLDETADVFKTTRSGMISQMVLMLDAMENNKQFMGLVKAMIKGAMK